MIKYEIRNRFTGDVQFVAEIDCAADERTPVKLRLAVLWALENKVDLGGANLIGVDLSGVDFRCSDLSGAILRGVGGWVIIPDRPPIIKNIHQSVANAVQGGDKLDMSDWHTECGTKHCRAGWVVVLAGAAGKELGMKLGTSAAAALIYAASDPSLETVPDFHCSDDEAMADILECAEREKNLEAAR